MSRIRDLASILTASSSMATDTEVSAVSAQIPTNVAGKNAVINGGFDIWQRGTSSSSTGYICADRWFCAGGNTTYSQESTAANLPAGFRYGLKMTMTATDTPYAMQAIETMNAIQFAGKRVILSYYASTSNSTDVTVRLDYSTTADTAIQGSYTQIAPVTGYSASASTTTSMSRVYAVYDVPSNALSLRIVIGSLSSLISGRTVTITGVQLEIGSTATSFSRAGGDIQGELAKCQRYYEQSAAAGTALSEGMSATVNGIASAYSASDMRSQRFDFKVTKRAVPTMTYYRSNDSATNGRWVYYVSGWTTPSSTSNGLVGYDSFNVYMTSSSAFTTRDCYIIEGGGWSASAEL